LIFLILVPLALADEAEVEEARLYRTFRPPSQTQQQRAAFERVSSASAQQSETQAASVSSLLSSRQTRSHLNRSLLDLSGSQLMARFTWEMRHMQVLHNGPVDVFNELTSTYVHDETPLLPTLESGFVQSVCHRFVFGGKQTRHSLGFYERVFHGHFGMQAVNENRWTLEAANECLSYSATNLLKSSMGNLIYGGITYVLAADHLHRSGKLVLNTCDSGTLQLLGMLRFLKSGTVHDFYHLVEQNTQFMNMPASREWHLHDHKPYSIAHLLNRWWADAPLPTSGMLAVAPYYEAIAVGALHLPEDLLYIIASFAEVHVRSPIAPAGSGSVGVWATEAGAALRCFLSDAGRPLVWTCGDDSPMLIDPLVGNVAGGANITDADRALFERYWQRQETPTCDLFDELARAAPPHLHLRLPAWQRRHACHNVTSTTLTLGTDFDGNCVYVERRHATEGRFELMNDGSCEEAREAYAPRAVYASESECRRTSEQARFRCRSVAVSDARTYCSQHCELTLDVDSQNSENTTSPLYTSLHDCSANCFC
jgi:hypothetical protein